MKDCLQYEMKAGHILGYGAEGCVMNLGETEVAKVIFIQPAQAKNGMTDADYMTLQQTIRALDPDEQYFVTTKRIVTAPLETFPPDLQVDIQRCHAIFKGLQKVTNNTQSSGFVPVLTRDTLVKLYIQNKVRPIAHPTTWPEKYFRHIQEGLAQLHENGISHNDIHDKNFAMGANGLPVFIDFDSATETNYKLPKFVWNAKEKTPHLEIKKGTLQFNDFNKLQTLFDEIEDSKMSMET